MSKLLFGLKSMTVALKEFAIAPWLRHTLVHETYPCCHVHLYEL